MIKRMRLDAILKEHGWVNDEQIQLGLIHQERSGCRWGSALIELGIIDEAKLTQALCEQYATPVWDPTTFTPDPTTMALFRSGWQRRNGVLPLTYDEQARLLHVAVRDPEDRALADEIRAALNLETLIISAAPHVTLEKIWDKYFGPVSRDEFTTNGARPKRATAAGDDITEKGTLMERADSELDVDINPPDPEQLETSGKILLDELWKAVESRTETHVLLWLARRHLADQVAALLESEHCVVEKWDGLVMPPGQWDYLIYDQDNAESHPMALATLRKEYPRLRLVRRTSFASAMLRTPISYEQMRNGYLWLTEQSTLWLTQNADAAEVMRYVTAVGQHCGLATESIDTIAVACYLEMILRRVCPTVSDRDMLLSAMECPYPAVEILQRRTSAISRTGRGSDAPSPEAAICDVLLAFFEERRAHPITTIEQAAQFGEWLHRNAEHRFDPAACDALMRVIREEILDSYLPPGPSEALLVGTSRSVWGELPGILNAEGWRVVISQDVNEARSLVSRRRPDVAVWAGDEAMDWIRWQSRCAPTITSFLIMDHIDSGLARTAILAGYEDVWSGNWDPVVAAAKLRRAVERRPHPPSATQAVRGSLAQFSLIDMIQILAAGGRSVKIDISHGKSTGRLVLWHGQIKYAEAESLSGEKAFYEMLTWHEGTFSCTPVDAAPEPNCNMANEAMLLEGCRQLDERRISTSSTEAATLFNG